MGRDTKVVTSSGTLTRLGKIQWLMGWVKILVVFQEDSGRKVGCYKFSEEGKNTDYVI